MNYLFYLQILPGAAEVADSVMRITPAGLGGYGLALMTLIGYSYFTHKRATKAETMAEVQAAKMLEFGMAMSSQLASNQSLLDMLKGRPEINRDILRVVEANGVKLERVIEKIEKPKP